MKHQGSIKKRLIGIILLVATLTSLVGYGSFVYWYMDDQQNRSLNLAETVGLVLGQDIAKLILLNEMSAAADITSKLKSFPDLNTMVLHKLNGKAIFQYSKKNTSFRVTPLPPESQRGFKIIGNTLKLYIDAKYQDTRLGYIQLNIQIKTIWDVIKHNIITLVMILLFMLLMSYLLAIFFAKQFTEPILKLVLFLEKIDFFDPLKQRIFTKEKNEYGKLYEEVNAMLERMESSQKAQKIAAVAFETQSGMTITDADQNILQINKAFTEITGYRPDEVIGKTPSILNSGQQSDEFYKNMYETLNKQHYWAGEIYNRRKNGTVFPEYLTIQAVLDNDENTIYYVASFVDLTLQKETEKKLQYLRHYDTLTGLANREMLIQNIQQHLDEDRQQGWGALICFDLQDFKMINDAYGHTVGDLLLQQITNRLRDSFKYSDMIGRVGGDEFAMWFSYIDGDKVNASVQCETVAQQLITILTQPFKLNDKTIHPIPYVGISLYNQDDKDANALLKQADGALHHVKQKQDRDLAFFDKHAEKMLKAHLDMHAQLLLAVEKKQFELFYQLQYDQNRKAYGAEALIRWNHPEKGMISPAEFIPIAERTGLILPIGLWVMRTACTQLTLWQKNPTTSGWTLAVNISAKQFNQEEFLEQTKKIIKECGIRRNSLKIELTESILVDNIDTVIQKMKQLQKLGIQISLDDFGTGYSSLRYLRNLPLNQVKIDRSFVGNMISNKNDVAIIKAVLLLGEAFELDVVAEGIETEEHFEFLKQLGCKFFQGYYFAYPQKISDIDKTISNIERTATHS